MKLLQKEMKLLTQKNHLHYTYKFLTFLNLPTVPGSSNFIGEKTEGKILNFCDSK
uniref:Uncharacterized protein n=1 Tax=Arundo donax TaxID=35708 RepID=A0A0A8YJV4_ARUDO